MPLTKADYTDILKTDYQGPIVDQLENTTYMLSRMEKNTEATGGNEFYIPVRIGRTSSIGARTDGSSETVPAGGKARYSHASFVVRSLYATIRITGLSMRASRNSTYAFAKAQVRTMEDTVTDLKKDVNRQMFGDGSAELCQISAQSGTNPCTFTVTNLMYPTWPTKFIYAGQKIDIATLTSGALEANGTSITVVAVPSTTTFTAVISAAIGGTAARAVYREGNVTSSSPYSKEITGLWAAIQNRDPSNLYYPGTNDPSDTRLTLNFGNIARATAGNEFWQGNTLQNSGTRRPFSVNLVQQGIDEAEIKGGGKTTLIQTNHPIYRMYGSLLIAAKVYNDNLMQLDGGWEALSVNGIPMVKDVEAPDYAIMCLDETTFELGVLGDWAWLGDDGEATTDILTRLPQQDQYEAVMNRDAQLICNKPIANTLILDVDHS